MSDIASRVKAIIVDKLGVDEKEVTPTASFTNDLGADSLDTVELIMEFEKEFNIDSILRPAIFTPASKRLDVLLGEFRKTRQHIAIVVDEYGKMEGLITLENILEQIVGEIEDEYDYAEEANIRTLSENEYTLKGATPLKEFNKHFKTRFKDKTFKTIAGFLMHQFGELPKIDEKITIENFEFTILSATSRKIRLVKVRLG